MSTLYVAHLLEAGIVAAPAGLNGAGSVGPVSSYRRVVVECVTVHPDAGLPPAPDEGNDDGDERRFVARLLADATEQPEPDPDAELEFGLVEDDTVECALVAVRRLYTVDIGFDDDFWARHRDAWWAREPVMAGVTLRPWLSGPSDAAPYQVAAFEALLDPAWSRDLTDGSFTSAAYW